MTIHGCYKSLNIKKIRNYKFLVGVCDPADIGDDWLLLFLLNINAYASETIDAVFQKLIFLLINWFRHV